MGLNTDFNQSPYFDDFDDTKNYHRVLFKPAVAVQARELTQLQTILQNQIERFGDNILIEGTIVQGGNFVEESNLAYVKVRDIAFNTSGSEVSTDVNDYVGMKAVGLTTGVEAIIIATEFGLESQVPDLSTLYVKYTKTAIVANTNVKTFSSTEEIQLYSKDASGDFTVPFHKVTVAGAIDPESIGLGHGVRCGEGIIYQKGHFIRFTEGLTIVSKYSNKPDGVVVGFQTSELIVDSNSDASLLDNANGFNNENAPGADRLQLVPALVVKTTAEAAADDEFFAIQEYSNGKVVRRKLSTQYNQIERTMEQRTVEESGNYVVQRFPVSVTASAANNQTLDVVVGAGLGYIEGKRVELLSDLTVSIPEADTFVSAAQQDVNTNYGSYVEVTSMTGRYDFAAHEIVNLRNAANSTTLGTARIRTVTRDGSNYRLYLFQITMNSGFTFADVRKVVSTTATGVADVILVNGNATLTDANFNKGFFPIGKSFIRAVDSTKTDFVYRTANTQNITTATLTITLAGANDIFPYTLNSSLNTDERNEIIVIANASVGSVSTGEVLTVTAGTLDGTGKVLTLTLNKNPGGTLSVTSYINVKRTAATINQKTLVTAYVKIQANTNVASVNGPYSLGLPDVYELVGVWKGDAATTWATLEANATANASTNSVTNSFRLQNRQADDHYGLSSISKRRAITIGSNDKIIVKVKVFQKDAQPGHFFAVNSYPVDDVTIPLPDNKIRTENIPTYTAANDTRFYLRDVIDLRPYAANTAAYATTASTATTNPSATVTFSSLITPAPNKTIETEYSYYLGRKDLVFIDARGNFSVIQGTPAETPVWPSEPSKGLTLARLTIPPYPSLPASAANRLLKPDYGVSVSSKQPRRYTMQDIGGIEQRLNNLEYYTSLSLLETSAKDFLVTDANGLDRFKNGIFVDNFETLYLADVNGGEYKAAIDITEKNVHPSFRQYSLDLKVKSTSGATNHSGSAVTLTKSDIALPSISQPFASAVKNLVTQFYSYVGNMTITPEYDSAPETIRAPNMNIDIDLVTPFIEFTEDLSRFVPLARSSTTSRSNSTTNTTGNTTTIRTTTTNTTTTDRLSVTAGRAEVQQVGDFVTDVNFSPFMRAKDLYIHVTGLRPNTRFYFFFDGKDINAHVARARGGFDVLTSAGTSTSARNLTGVRRVSGFGNQVIISDANGELDAIFRIPAGQFAVGDRTLTCIDVNDIKDKDAATSYATANYSAYNFSVTKSRLTVTTRPPRVNVSTTRTTSTSTRTTTFVRDNDSDGGDFGGTGGGRVDPLAQSFIIDANLSSDTDVFVSKVDVFFAKKSRVGNGVTIQIREMENGYPSPVVVPFGSVHLKAAQVNAPTISIATNALTPTTITFPVPLALKTETEYCMVMIPDGNDPDYLAWISRTGEKDVDTGVSIVQDTNAGVLFTSTNNLTWTPYQNENVKFTLYAARFSNATGQVTLTNNDHEFLDIENVSGEFSNGETAFIEKSSFLTGSVSTTEGSTTVTGSGTSFTTQYNAGDHIVLRINATTYDVLKIKTINSSTSMTLDDVARYTVSGLTSHYTSPVGEVVYFDINEPPILILENSTAKSSSFKFSATDKVRGENSGATATIVTVKNQPISYVQPAIYRTNFTQTRTSLRATKLFDGVAETYSKDMAFNSTNYLNERTYYVKSKSNDFTSSGFELTVTLQNTAATTRDTSPVIDAEISSVMVAEYFVNNDSANETTAIGNASAKYVSKKIELADGMDADDLKVLIGAYRPVGTAIEVYAKFESQFDIRNFRDVEWTKLEIKPETDAASSSVNMFDYREYEYNLGTIAKAAGQGAWSNAGTINYIDPTGAVYKDFKYFQIKIVMLADGHHRVPRIKDLRALALT